MVAKSVGSLAVLALRACSGTLDGSDKIEVALLRSRRDDNAAGLSAGSEQCCSSQVSTVRQKSSTLFVDTVLLYSSNS